ncbi:hypothetical protein [Methanoculleus sp.]|uniref:hypothetical protein n=1 Tax=Methanoculleus sp. TaxID=90427 RepID=UPI002FC63462
MGKGRSPPDTSTFLAVLLILAAAHRPAFERVDGVALRFVFKKGDESHQLYGLWFNSPKLRS